MLDAEARREIELFARLLDYPEDSPVADLRACEELLGARSAETARRLREFRAVAEEEPLGRLQELYTGAFDLDTLSDLDATCYPYVGHHLFGESYKRSTFMLELAERYRAHGYAVERELPDHLVVMLRFLARCPDDELTGELAVDAIVPALRRMVGEGEELAAPPDRSSGRQVYQRLLQALRLALEERLPPPEPSLAAPHADPARPEVR